MAREGNRSLLSEALDAENVWRRHSEEARHQLLRRIQRGRQIRWWLAMAIALFLAGVLVSLSLSGRFAALPVSP